MSWCDFGLGPGEWRSNSTTTVWYSDLKTILNEMWSALYERCTLLGGELVWPVEYRQSFTSGQVTSDEIGLLRSAINWLATYNFGTGEYLNLVDDPFGGTDTGVNGLLALGSYGSSWLDIDRAQNASIWMQIREVIENMKYVYWHYSAFTIPVYTVIHGIGGSVKTATSPYIGDLVATAIASWNSALSATPEEPSPSLLGAQWHTSGSGRKTTRLFSPATYLKTDHLCGTLVNPTRYRVRVSAARYNVSSGFSVTFDGVTYTPPTNPKETHVTSLYDCEIDDWPNIGSNTPLSFSILPSSYPSYPFQDGDGDPTTYGSVLAVVSELAVITDISSELTYG